MVLLLCSLRSFLCTVPPSYSDEYTSPSPASPESHSPVWGVPPPQSPTTSQEVFFFISHSMRVCPIRPSLQGLSSVVSPCHLARVETGVGQIVTTQALCLLLVNPDVTELRSLWVWTVACPGVLTARPGYRCKGRRSHQTCRHKTRS